MVAPSGWKRCGESHNISRAFGFYSLDPSQDSRDKSSALSVYFRSRQFVPILLPTEVCFVKRPIRQSTRKPVIGVMGPAKAGIRELADAKTLGELIARQGWVVLTGGRASGVMDAASEGAKSVPGSLTIGILPDGKTRVSRYVDVAIITDLGQARNNVNVMSSDVIVACGLGGTGTVSEVALALKAKKTVILLGADKAGVGLFKNLAPHLVHAAASPEEAVKLIGDLL